MVWAVLLLIVYGIRQSYSSYDIALGSITLHVIWRWAVLLSVPGGSHPLPGGSLPISGGSRPPISRNKRVSPRKCFLGILSSVQVLPSGLGSLTLHLVVVWGSLTLHVIVV